MVNETENESGFSQINTPEHPRPSKNLPLSKAGTTVRKAASKVPAKRAPAKPRSVLGRARKTAQTLKGTGKDQNAPIHASTVLNEPDVTGHTEPRVFTPPLRELTPATSFGFNVITFARDIGRPLDPWQEWVVIHAGELLPNGLPRFRKVLVVVARQNGKSELGVILALYWMYVDQVKLVFGTSTKLPYAQETHRKAYQLAQKHPELSGEITKIRTANGTEEFSAAGSRYLIGAANADGGRSLTIDRLIIDELRHHYTYDAWNASVPATNAVKDAQIWGLTNAGTERSVVLNDQQDAATKYARTGEGDPRAFIAEYSAPEGSNPMNPEHLAYANPNLGRRNSITALLGEAATAVEKGGPLLAGFKTESMCMRVPTLNPAVDTLRWAAAEGEGDLTAVRGRLALCFDVSLDGLAASAYVAAKLPDGRTRVEGVRSFTGVGAGSELAAALAGILESVRPKVVGWFPGGPGAELATGMSTRLGWPPRGVRFEEIRGEASAVCMGFSAAVSAERLVHHGQDRLTAQIELTEKLFQGDAWRFSRRGSGSCESVYAAAGAWHLAQTVKGSQGKPMVISARR